MARSIEDRRGNDVFDQLASRDVQNDQLALGPIDQLGHIDQLSQNDRLF